MKLSNPFPLRVRLLFIDTHACWECGRNGNGRGGMELHHIWGRISGSALNAAPLCKVCHDGIAHNQETHRRLLRKTIAFLLGQHYKLEPADNQFLDMVTTDLQGFTL